MQTEDQTAACSTLRGSCKTVFYINTRFVPHREQSVGTDVTSQLMLHGEIIGVLSWEPFQKKIKTQTLCGNMRTVAVSEPSTRSQCVSPMEITFSRSINEAASATEHNKARKNTSSLQPPPPPNQQTHLNAIKIQPILSTLLFAPSWRTSLRNKNWHT